MRSASKRLISETAAPPLIQIASFGMARLGIARGAAFLNEIPVR